MKKYPEIKHFVQETLGCTCPEEVFENIEYERVLFAPWERRMKVGNRLLIYVINIDAVSDLPGKLNSALELGVAERNSEGFNRFRLVLVSARPNDLRAMAESAFHESAYYDDKTHLHVVSEKDVPELGINT